MIYPSLPSHFIGTVNMLIPPQLPFDHTGVQQLGQRSAITAQNLGLMWIQELFRRSQEHVQTPGGLPAALFKRIERLARLLHGYQEDRSA